ncbi:MAG: HAD-IIIA family hydrolase [Anaerolineae bacterium]|jgi:D-glycero-D-manno-heptose 1,7-bisphosphate phosphatase|nr:HAD-IIIA family hydrolase [Anaerolineae bacterium]
MSFEAVNKALWQALEDLGAYYNALYYCPHNPDAEAKPCGCRKPQPGLLFQAAVDLGIDLQRSFMIGDKASDLGAGRAAGCRVVLVRTGWGKRTLSGEETGTTKPDYVADTLLEAVQWIFRNL